MAIRIPLLVSLALGASASVHALSPAPGAPTKPTAATVPAAPDAAATTKPAKKAAPKKTATKPKDAPKKTLAKADAKPKQTTYTTGPKEVKDKDGNVIPTDPAAYPIDSALPKKK